MNISPFLGIWKNTTMTCCALEFRCKGCTPFSYNLTFCHSCGFKLYSSCTLLKGLWIDGQRLLFILTHYFRQMEFTTSNRNANKTWFLNPQNWTITNNPLDETQLISRPLINANLLSSLIQCSGALVTFSQHSHLSSLIQQGQLVQMALLCKHQKFVHNYCLATSKYCQYTTVLLCKRTAG